jgi:hypothetical protein
MEVWSVFDLRGIGDLRGIVMAGRDPAIPLRKARRRQIIGIAGSSPAMTAGEAISSGHASVVRVLRHET